MLHDRLAAITAILQSRIDNDTSIKHTDHNKEYGDRLFSHQYHFVSDSGRFLVAQCSRRAGKTNGLALRFFRTLNQYPSSFCPYVALTRDSARNIIWPILQEIDEKYEVGCKFIKSKLTMEHPNGARLQLFGADMKNFIRRLKGIKTPGAAIDEAQDFGPHLQSLVDDVLTPALTDYSDSWLAITGTPGPIPTGYFYDISQLGRYGFSVHKWTLLNNPYLPQAHSFIEELKQKHEWDDNHPTLLREWRNQWVLDLESLLIRYNEKLNDYQHVPFDKMNYIMGIDLGFNDADAIAIIGWNERSGNTYLVDELVTRKQGMTELVNQIELLRLKYNPSKLVIDEGGLGKKMAEEMRRRHGLPLTAADKARKMETVEFLNDHLRTSRFKARKNSQFVADSYKVELDWDKSTPDRIVIKDSFHSDIIDAVLYAFRESPAYTYRAPIKKPKYGSEEWAMQESEEMERLAEEQARKQ